MRHARAWRLATVLAFFLSSAAIADTVTVTNTSDGTTPGPAGSLRNAIAIANPGDTVDFDPSIAGQTITLTSGAILIGKDLTIYGAQNRITVSGNHLHQIFFIGATSTVVLDTLTFVDGSDGDLGGGGVVNFGTLRMYDCTVTSCTASNGGAGILNLGTLTMNTCTVAGNVATGGNGAGVVNESPGTLTMNRCTVSGNVAASGVGGGVMSTGAGTSALIKYCTIAYNASSGIGGGIYATGSPASSVVLEASIVARNQGSTSPDCSGTLGSNGSNVLTSTAGCTLTGTTASNLVADPKLGSLQRNGGPTKTHALRPGSPAIDFVQAASCGLDLADQRGMHRPLDGDASGTAACDAGAYEAITPIVVTSLADPGDETTCTLRQAVAAANTNSAQGTCAAGISDFGLPDRIIFGVTGKVTLGGTPIAPSESVMIEGPGADKMKLSGGGASGVVAFDEGSAANTYVLSGVTLTEGLGGVQQASGASYTGTDDTLAFDRCFFTSEAASELAIPTCLYVFGARAVEVAGSTCTSSSSVQEAMRFRNTPASIVDSTVVAPNGEGINVFADAEQSASLSLLNATLVGGDGATTGLYVDGAAAVADYRATIFSSFHPNVALGTGTATSLGYNVASDESGGFTGSGDLKNTDAKLGALTYNGGPIPTVNLKADSPAKDIVTAAATLLTLDERGFLRPVGGSDAGAVERVIGGDADGSGTMDIADVFYMINFLFASGPVPVYEADVNGDGVIDVADVFYMINTLFAGGPGPV
jgi:Dockerin type I domain